MGLTTLPNGIEYFSLSEEFKALLDGIYGFLTPVHVAVIVLFTGFFLSLLVALIFYEMKRSIDTL